MRILILVTLLLASQFVIGEDLSLEGDLTLAAAKQQDPEPCQVNGGGPTVDCDSTSTIDDNCFRRCCKSSGVCFSSSCVTTFGAPNNAEANCAGPCLDETVCNPYVLGCSDPHCLGFVSCVENTACGGHLPGDICLYDGVSKNFKVCDMRPDDGGLVVGDPQFIGLRGQNYQIHGVSGEIYNIVSDNDFQYNSRFVFLHKGDCPVVDGKKQKGCFSHPGSYLGELGIKTRAGDKIHWMTGPAAQGFSSITLNDKPLELGEVVQLAGDLGYLSYNTTHLSSIYIGNWELDFENSDRFVNQRVRVLQPAKLRSHGLLGQTWRTETYKNAIKYIAGTVDDYVIRDDGIFGDNFVFNTFN